jgi:hypothetical protein
MVRLRVHHCSQSPILDRPETSSDQQTLPATPHRFPSSKGIRASFSKRALRLRPNAQTTMATNAAMRMRRNGGRCAGRCAIGHQTSAFNWPHCCWCSHVQVAAYRRARYALLSILQPADEIGEHEPFTGPLRPNSARILLRLTGVRTPIPVLRSGTLPRRIARWHSALWTPCC